MTTSIHRCAIAQQRTTARRLRSVASVLGAIAAVAIAGCTDANPTGVVSSKTLTPETVRHTLIAAAPTSGLIASLDDAQSRIVPTLGSADQSASLRAALATLRAALSANDADSTASALRLSRDAIAALRQQVPGADADLSAIELTVSAADAAIPSDVKR